jgi:demethylmenaquinone methyltransferase/2-methoxy-6-polyprenyl-1,4-benzoquinol methylase
MKIDIISIFPRLFEPFLTESVLGKAVVGDDEPYRYLVESIRGFPNQARFAAMLRDAGFERVSYRNLSGGIVAIHSGWKL